MDSPKKELESIARDAHNGVLFLMDLRQRLPYGQEQDDIAEAVNRLRRLQNNVEAVARRVDG